MRQGLRAFLHLKPPLQALLPAMSTQRALPLTRQTLSTSTCLFRLGWLAQLTQFRLSSDNPRSRLLHLMCLPQTLVLVECKFRLLLPRHLGRWVTWHTRLVLRLILRRAWEHLRICSLLFGKALPTFGTHHRVKVSLIHTTQPRIRIS